MEVRRGGEQKKKTRRSPQRLNFRNKTNSKNDCLEKNGSDSTLTIHFTNLGSIKSGHDRYVPADDSKTLYSFRRS